MIYETIPFCASGYSSSPFRENNYVYLYLFTYKYSKTNIRLFSTEKV